MSPQVRSSLQVMDVIWGGTRLQPLLLESIDSLSHMNDSLEFLSEFMQLRIYLSTAKGHSLTREEGETATCEKNKIGFMLFKALC
jgi:hypothetical protein